MYAFAASSAIDLLSSLKKLGSSAPTNASQLFDDSLNADAGPIKQPKGLSRTTSGGALSADTHAALLAAQSQDSGQPQAPQSRSGALKNLFSLLDNDGDGQISKTEFETNLGAGGTNVQAADNVFAKLDKDNDGSVSAGEFSSALRGAGRRHAWHYGAGGINGAGEGAGAGSSNALSQALQGASSTSTSNSDGSTSTTVTYADGSKVTLTSPAASTSSNKASSSYNYIEQAIQRQANALSVAGKQAFSVSA